MTMRLLLLLCLALPAAAASRDAEAPWFRTALVCNDDGIDDPRLHALARAVAATGARTVVVAPLENCSGSSNYTSVFARKAFAVEPRDLGEGIEAWAVDGFPGDCVLWALLELLKDDRPDVVLSGINSGPNLADAWMASGTIGVARLAAHEGIPAVAYSGLSTRDAAKMDAVPRWCVDLALSDVVRDLPDGRYLNVNFPMGEDTAIQGVAWCPPGARVFHDRFEPGEPDATGRTVWTLKWWTEDGDQPDGGDVDLHREGWISVSPMRAGDPLPTGAAPELPDWRR